MTDEYEYDVFGAVRAHTGGGASEFTYTGEQNDPTGLEYLRARYYDGATGRFLSEDPIPSSHSYSYVGSNPARFVDPAGACRVEVRLKSVKRGGITVGRPSLTLDWNPFDWDAAYHAYIVTYDPIDGSEKAYRGQSSGGGSSGSGGSSAAILSVFGPSGQVEVVRESWAPGFPDWDPQDKHKVHEVQEEDGKSCQTIRSRMNAAADAINAADIGYLLLTQNSSSAARELLEQAGLSTDKPGARRFWRDRYWIPGWGTDLLDGD